MEKLTAKFRKALFALATIKQVDLRSVFDKLPNRYDVYAEMRTYNFVWLKDTQKWCHKSIVQTPAQALTVTSKFAVRITADTDDAIAVAEIITAALLAAGIGVNTVSNPHENADGKSARVYMKGEI